MEGQDDGLRVHLSRPQNGWIELAIKAHGQEFNQVISYTPNDFLLELVRAMSLALQGVDGVAVASCEPTFYEFTFSAVTDQGLLHFRISMCPDRARGQRTDFAVLSSIAPAHDIVTPFWRALRELEGRVRTSDYREAMQRDFPTSGLKRLSALIGRQRHQ